MTASRIHLNGLGGSASGTISGDKPVWLINRDVWYVCSTNGSDTSGYGRERRTPLASLYYAVSSVASSNDMIVLLDGHAESVTQQISITQDYLIISGEGTVTLTNAMSATDMISVSGTRALIQGITFGEPLVATTGSALVISGEHRIENCVFNVNGNCDDYALRVTDGARIIDCTFTSTSTTFETRPYPALLATQSSTLPVYLRGCTFDGGTVGFADGSGLTHAADLSAASTMYVIAYDISLLNGADMLMAINWTGNVSLSSATGDGAVLVAEAS